MYVESSPSVSRALSVREALLSFLLDRSVFSYVRRSLPHNVDDPREHFLSVRDLLVTAEPATDDENFLRDLREYFSVYGPLYACKYCAETTKSNYILIEFADYGQRRRCSANLLIFLRVDL